MPTTRRSRRSRGERNLRLLLTGGMPDPGARMNFRSLTGGFLAQTRDNGRIDGR